MRGLSDNGFQHLGCRTDVRLHVLGLQALLFHAEFDGIHHVCRANGVVFGLTRLDQDDQNLYSVGLKCALRELKHRLQSGKSGGAGTPVQCSFMLST